MASLLAASLPGGEVTSYRSNVSVSYQTDSFLKRELVVDFGKFELGCALA